MSERLEEIDAIVDAIYKDRIELREFVKNALEQEEKVDSMVHITKLKNREIRELSDFLKERNIPLKALSPLVTVMNYVQELEEQLKDRDSAISTGIHVSNLIKKQNKRYREARDDLNAIYDENHRPYPSEYESGYLDGLDRAIGIVDEALEDGQ